jgi:hypothetical protein
MPTGRKPHKALRVLGDVVDGSVSNTLIPVNPVEFEIWFLSQCTHTDQSQQKHEALDKRNWRTVYHISYLATYKSASFVFSFIEFPSAQQQQVSTKER